MSVSVKTLEYEEIKSENDALKKELAEELSGASKPHKLQRESKLYEELYKAEKEQSRNAKKKLAE